MPEVIINGPAGRIEGRYHQNPDPKAPVALVLHPQPLYGGTMNNKVVYNMYKNFVDNGFSVLRFNFRGVGRSQGVFDEGIGELQDATVALNWLHNQNMDAQSFWVSGFSFGAWIGLQLVMRRPDVEDYILAAPPVSKYDFNFTVPCPASGLIVQGDNDDISKESDTAKLVEKLSLRDEAKIEYEIIEKADHFFREHIDKFNEVIDEHIKEKIVENASKVRKVKRDRRRRRKKKNAIIPKSERYISPIKPLSSF